MGGTRAPWWDAEVPPAYTERSNMPTPDAFVDAPETFSITEAARLLGLTPQTIRKAIRKGEIEAFIIGNREPLKSGRGMGYRITRAALQSWYFGKTK